METSPDKDTRTLSKIGDRATSDVVVRIRTDEGRDEWFYCHSHILTENSKYFSERLSENWPTCQILDSRNCVEVHCQESEFNHHVTFLRLLYVVKDDLATDNLHGVRNAIGILQVAFELGCQRLVFACVGYLEAVPWEEAEEEEILRIIPRLGSQAESILARLQPVDPVAIRKIFISSLRFATSSPPESMNDLKCSAQEQLEYMITEDDDAPLVTADDKMKSEVIECIRRLFTRFYGLLESFLRGHEECILEAGKIKTLRSHLSDLSWASQILVKLETMKEFVHSWVEASEKIVKVVENASPDADMLETKLKVIEVLAKVLEAIGYGTVILPTSKRLHMVKLWLPFVRRIKPLVDSVVKKDDDMPPFTVDGELWQSLESAFVSIVLALPSGDQAEILTDWLGTEHIQYPDLTEAFEVWCYRSKVAKRRLALLGSTCGIADSMTLS
ncbi:BTB/POZ domain-containing protein At3g05675 [Telopea speciosissima]|uniref:BTB/POZ domain-containing protein At3g05675 n=1 Tax=Telopea speciosissima TaxID=54955 RepID=UPI001CC7CE13|nr:BTB/POZ domain-containing protein At3g05675 [Telopea speciosissima]